MRRIALITLLACLALAAPAAASSTQMVTFEGGSDLLRDSTRDATLDDIQSLGASSLRVILYWRSVAPGATASKRPTFDETDPSGYDWGAHDRLISDARSRGMRVILTVSGPVPNWASASHRSSVTRPSPTHFQRFMTAVGRQYGGQVAAWSIWNEPNHPDFLAPQYVHGKPESPRLYRALFQAADRGLQAAGRGSDTLIMGETAPHGTSRAVAPLTFLRGALCLSESYHRSRSCGRLDADGYAHHAYTQRSGPGYVAASSNDVNIGTLSRLTTALDRAGRAGAIRRSMPIYLTEFGIQSYPDPYAGVSLSKQAEFLSLSEWIAYRNPRVRSFSQYLMRDDDPRPGSAAARYSGFESGLRRSDGRKKPAYDAFRTPLVVDRRGSRVYLWGLVRPGGGQRTLTVQYRSGGGSWRTLATKHTNSRGVWSGRSAYRAGRTWRVRWQAPDGAVYDGPATHAT